MIEMSSQFKCCLPLWARRRKYLSRLRWRIGKFSNMFIVLCCVVFMFSASWSSATLSTRYMIGEEATCAVGEPIVWGLTTRYQVPSAAYIVWLIEFCSWNEYNLQLYFYISKIKSTLKHYYFVIKNSLTWN